MPSVIAEAAERLTRAATDAAPCHGLGDLFDNVDGATGYMVQSVATEAALASGRTIIGYKIGLTSAQAQARFNADEPMRGILFDNSRVINGDFVDLSRLIAPRLEGEIVLKVAATPDLTMNDAALAATIASAHAAFEIADSRISGWKIGIGEAIADNACCARIGWLDEGVSLGTIDLAMVAMTIRDREGAVLEKGTGAACLGTPLNAYRWLIAALARDDIVLAPGHHVLTGALASPMAMTAGKSYSIELSGLGSIGLRT